MACDFSAQWIFPTSLIDPLIWHWTHLRFYDEPNELQGAHARGASWYQLAMDFEISTRIPLSRRGPDNAPETIMERAGLMSDASKALLRGFGVKLRHQIIHCRSIQAFRSTARAGLRHRPALLRSEAVGPELGLQVMMHPSLMEIESTQWKWIPNLRFLPPALYSPVYIEERLRHTKHARLLMKTTFRPESR